MGVMAHGYFKGAGFHRGFDEWKIVPGITFDPNTDREVTSPRSEAMAEQMLGDPRTTRAVSSFGPIFSDPHDLYMRHEGIDWGKTSRDRYDGEVTFTDQYIGKLLDFIAGRPWASRAVIIVTSDHGEEFGEHGMTRHGFEIWETLVHVPLIVVARAPAPPDRRLREAASTSAPPSSTSSHVPTDPRFEGKSLVPEIYGSVPEARDVVVDLPATSDNAKRRALVRGKEKLICFDDDGHCRLYDVETDPLERSPISKGDDFRDMRARYRALARTIKEVAPFACAADCLNGGYRKASPAGSPSP